MHARQIPEARAVPASSERPAWRRALYSLAYASEALQSLQDATWSAAASVQYAIRSSRPRGTGALGGSRNDAEIRSTVPWRRYSERTF